MKTLKLVCMAMLCLAVSLVSCSGEDGDTGPQGPAGAAGVAGVDGADGISCWDLNGNGVGDAEEDINDDGNFDAMDCQGSDGATGNANVQSFDIEIIEWGNENIFEFDIPIESPARSNYSFLFYLEVNDENGLTHPVPGKVPFNPIITDVLYSNADVTPNASITFSDLNGNPFMVPEGFYQRLIIIAVEISSTSGKANSESLISELKAAGVDTSDYNQVAAYLGLE
jgi:hypothetical protein